MKKIAIYGAGGFGKEVASTIMIINKQNPTWNLIGFYDDGIEKGTAISHFGKVLGGMEDLNSYGEPLCVAIAIGHPQTLRVVRNKITNPNISFPNIIFEPFGKADEKTFHIGEGNIIQGGCWASFNVSIGNFNVLNGMVILGHDVKIGDFNCIMPDVRVSGEVTIGEENLLGVRSLVMQQIKIGKQIQLAPGAVLLTKPKDGHTYIGNPAKLFKF